MSSVGVNPPKTPVTKGSNGVAAATVPNVCKMPGPPAPFVPAPLPNIGKSGDSPKGYTKKVKVEGKSVAIQGASFKSTGDVASKGTGGGMVSMNTHGATKFAAPGSLDVKFEGKNVQFLGDQMLNNCGPSGNPPNSATMMGVLQGLITAATTEKPTTTCSSGGGHDWIDFPALGTKSTDDKINDSAASPSLGSQFEAAAATHNRTSGELQRSDQLSDDSDYNEKIWWICGNCGLEREGDQLHDDPAGSNKPIAVEVKSKRSFSASDARQLGRNCNAVLSGGASGLIYKLPAGPQCSWLVKHIRDVGNHMGVVIRVVRV